MKANKSNIELLTVLYMTAAIVTLAQTQRGYFAIGSEWLVPVLYYSIKKFIKELF